MVWYGDRPASHFMRSTIRNTPPCQDYHFPMSGIRGCTIRPTYPRHGTYDTAMSGIRGFRLALRYPQLGDHTPDDVVRGPTRLMIVLSQSIVPASAV